MGPANFFGFGVELFVYPASRKFLTGGDQAAQPFSGGGGRCAGGVGNVVIRGNAGHGDVSSGWDGPFDAHVCQRKFTMGRGARGTSLTFMLVMGLPLPFATLRRRGGRSICGEKMTSVADCAMSWPLPAESLRDPDDGSGRLF